MSAGKAERKAARERAITFETNARFTDEEKPLVSENARMERRRLAEVYQTVTGDFIARTAASGFDPNFGSAKAVVGDAKRAYDIDRKISAKNEVRRLREKDLEAYNFRRQAQVSRMEGEAARTAGYLRAASTLLQIAPTISGMLPSGKGG